MKLGDLIRSARKKAFCTQLEFAERVGVASSTINRWELNKSIPHLKAMKQIKAFCEENNIPFSKIQKEWEKAINSQKDEKE